MQDKRQYRLNNLHIKVAAFQYYLRSSINIQTNAWVQLKPRIHRKENTHSMHVYGVFFTLFV